MEIMVWHSKHIIKRYLSCYYNSFVLCGLTVLNNCSIIIIYGILVNCISNIIYKFCIYSVVIVTVFYFIKLLSVLYSIVIVVLSATS